MRLTSQHITGALLCLSSSAFAAPITEVTEDGRWFGMFEGGAGLNQVSETIYSDDPSGLAGRLALGLSYVIPSWNLDATLGWLGSSVTGTLVNTREQKISTRMALLELSPRYRIGPRLDLGPTFLVGTGTDTKFGTVVGTNSTTLFGGGKIALDISSATILARLTATYFSDLSVTGRTIHFIMGGIQLGFPFSSEGGIVERQESAPPAPQPITPVTAKVVQTPIEEPAPDVRLTLGMGKINFATNSHQLKRRSELALIKIGQFLRDRDNDWEILSIDGHTDARGGAALNQRLSERRADSVRKALILGGASPGKMRTRGFGPSRPTSKEPGEAGWSANRRVELLFRGVRAPEQFNNDISDFVNQLE